MPPDDEPGSPPDLAWNDILGQDCGTPAWFTGPDGPTVDLRMRQAGPVPSFVDMMEATYDDGREKTLPDGTTVGVRMFDHDGVGMLVRRGDRSALVVRDTGGTIGSATYAAMITVMPGIQGALPKVYAGTLVEAMDPAGTDMAAVVARRDETAAAGIDALMDVVTEPGRWVGDMDGVFDPSTPSGAVNVLGWASTGLSSATAAQFVRARVAPHPYTDWSWFGWDDVGILGWLPGSDWEPGEAAAYRDAGMSRDDAGLWLRNAQDVHPAAASTLATSGWSATGANRLRKAVEREDTQLRFASWWDPAANPYPLDGDLVMQAWAALPGLRAAQVIQCVRAGLSPEEVATGLTDGTFDPAQVAMMVALRH